MAVARHRRSIRPPLIAATTSPGTAANPSLSSEVYTASPHCGGGRRLTPAAAVTVIGGLYGLPSLRLRFARDGSGTDGGHRRSIRPPLIAAYPATRRLCRPAGSSEVYTASPHCGDRMVRDDIDSKMRHRRSIRPPLIAASLLPTGQGSPMGVIGGLYGLPSLRLHYRLLHQPGIVRHRRSIRPPLIAVLRNCGAS